MKFWTTTNKTNLRAVLCVALFFGFTLGTVQAQSTTLSPYSAFGIGREVPYLNARSMGMGGIAVGLSGKSNVSPLNPASYTMGVDTLSVLFDIGFYLNLNTLKQNVSGKSLRNQSTGGGLGNMEFYFPLFKWWKMGVYLRPYTEVSYASSNFRTNDSAHIGSTQLLHKGNGGLNRFGWGNAFGWGPVAVGLNLNYQFGSIDELYRLSFQDTSLSNNTAGSEVWTETRLNGLAIDVGFLYAQRLPHGKLTFGAAYNLAGKLYASRYTTGLSSYSVLNSDTAFFKSHRKGFLSIPAKIRAGLSYEDEDWLVGADVTYAWWSQYQDFGQSYDYFRNTLEAALGMELKPNYQNTSPMRRVAYRLGGRYGTHYADFGAQNLFGYAVNLGVGIPVRRSRSMINIGLEYGHNGGLAKEQIAENYFKIGLGFSSVETWFVKRKYD